MKTIKEGFLRKNLGLGKEELIRKWLDGHNLYEDPNATYEILPSGGLKIRGTRTIYVFNASGFTGNVVDVPDYIKIDEIGDPANLIYSGVQCNDWSRILPKGEVHSRHILRFARCDIKDNDIELLEGKFPHVCFLGCTELKNVKFGKGYNILKLELSECEDLKKITLDNDNIIYLDLWGNDSLESLEGAAKKCQELNLSGTELGDKIVGDLINLKPKRWTDSVRFKFRDQLEASPEFQDLLKKFPNLKYLYLPAEKSAHRKFDKLFKVIISYGDVVVAGRGNYWEMNMFNS